MACLEWPQIFTAEAFSSVTDRFDPVQRDAYARSTKYALMNSHAVCLFSIKNARNTAILMLHYTMIDGKLQEFQEKNKHTYVGLQLMCYKK